MTQLLLSRDPILNYNQLTVALSWQCNARCTHCYIPQDKRRRCASKSRLLDIILENLPNTIRIIGFTGGEPFLNPEHFVREIDKVGRSGRRCAVVTNGLWTRQHKKVDSVLREAFQAGLRALSVSYDLYHQPRLDQAEVTNLLRLARKVGLVVEIRGVGKRSFGLMSKVERSGVLLGEKNATSRHNLDNTGEAKGLPIDRVRNCKSVRCSIALCPLVIPDGTMFACCSTRIFEIQNKVLRLGNVRRTPISEMLDKASRDYLLVALLTLGPQALSKMIDPNTDVDTTRHYCEVCVSLLNDVQKLNRIREMIANDRNLRKKIVGRYMIYEHCYRPEMHPVYDT